MESELELFENKPLELGTLPVLNEEDFTGLHGEYLGLRLVSSSLLIAVLLVAGVFVYRSTNLALWHIYLPLALLSTLFIVAQVRGFKRKGYLLRERDISYRTGWLFTSTTTVPLVRIQHSEVTQGPLERLFDLATVKIYTAGGHQSDLAIPGLTPEEANKVRDYLNQTVAQHAA